MKEKIEQMLLAENWGDADFEVVEAQTPSLLTAGIETRGKWKIHITVDPQADKLDQILKNFNNGAVAKLLGRQKQNYFSGKDNLGNMLHTIIMHEIGHWKYCPFDIDSEEEIVSGVSEGLERAGFSKEKVQQYVFWVENMFLDIIDNVMNTYKARNDKRYIDGFLAFYAKAGLMQEYSDSMYIFVDTIAKLAVDDSEMREFAASFNPRASKLRQATNSSLKIFTEDALLAKKAMAEELSLEEKVRVYKAVGRKDGWHKKAIQFAELIAPYLKEDEKKNRKQNSMTNESGNGQPQQSRQGSGKEKRNKQNSQSDFEEKMREFVKIGLKKGHNTDYAPSFVADDELYRQRAEQISIKMKEQKGEELQMPVAYLRKRELGDRAYFDMSRIDWQNPDIAVTEQGDAELDFFERQVPVCVNEQGTEKAGRPRDILFVLDDSMSMMCDYEPEAGRGSYDLLMRAVYSVFKHLEDKEIIQNMNFGTVLFSSSTYFSGWHSYYNLEEVKKPMLEPDKFNSIGGTVLDTMTIVDAADKAPGKFWAVFVTDGEIENRKEVCDAIGYLGRKGHHVSFIDIQNSFLADPVFSFAYQMAGIDSSTKRAVAFAGGDYHTVSSPEDLPKLFLGKAEEVYQDN
jgi:hypothetical protein